MTQQFGHGPVRGIFPFDESLLQNRRECGRESGECGQAVGKRQPLHGLSTRWSQELEFPVRLPHWKLLPHFREPQRGRGAACRRDRATCAAPRRRVDDRVRRTRAARRGFAARGPRGGACRPCSPGRRGRSNRGAGRSPSRPGGGTGLHLGLGVASPGTCAGRRGRGCPGAPRRDRGRPRRLSSKRRTIDRFSTRRRSRHPHETASGAPWRGSPAAPAHRHPHPNRPNYPTAQTALEWTGSTVGWEMSDTFRIRSGSIEPDGPRPEFKGSQRHA